MGEERDWVCGGDVPDKTFGSVRYIHDRASDRIVAKIFVAEEAPLITAAPDLYEALKEVVRPYGFADVAISRAPDGETLNAFLALKQRIEAALSKASQP